MTQTRRRFLQTALAAGATLSSSTLMWPARADETGRLIISIQIPPPATRHLSELLTEIRPRYRYDLGLQPVVVSGNSGTLAVTTVSEAAPDGKTVLVLTSSTATLQPILQTAPPLSVDKLVPVAGCGELPVAFMVGPAVPEHIRTMKGYVDWVRANPAMNSYGVPGLGSAAQYVGSELSRVADLPLRPIAYKSLGAVVQDVAAGTVPAGVSLIPGPRVAIDFPRLRLLALVKRDRLPGFPDLPTLRESGYPVGIPVQSVGFFLPLGTPGPIVVELAAAIREASLAPRVRAAMDVIGMTPMTLPDEPYATTLEKERANWLAMIASERKD